MRRMLPGRAGLPEEDRGGDKEISRIYHITVLSLKLSQAVRRETNREGVGCILLDELFTKTGRLVVEVLREKHPDT